MAFGTPFLYIVLGDILNNRQPVRMAVGAVASLKPLGTSEEAASNMDYDLSIASSLVVK